jgi:uncharacterized protein YndB with AHSA1/START domain
MKMDIDATSVEEAVIVMSRLFDAPREKLWEALTTPAHVARWFGGPGFTSPVCEMDVRPGGIWRHVMRTPDGAEFAMDYIYLEVVKPEKLVWQHVDHGKGGSGPPTSVNTVTLEDHGAQTRWKMVARFTSIADRDRSVQMGFATMVELGCERLADLVRSL